MAIVTGRLSSCRLTVQHPRVVLTRFPFQAMSSESGSSGDSTKEPFYKRIFRSAKRREELEAEIEAESAYQEEEAMIAAIEAEKKQEKLLRTQNKSKLHFSDRQMLRGLPPNVGLTMEWCERHTTREHKAKLLGTFGRSKTGLDPSVAWPTRKQMKDQAEYEKVLYNGLSLAEMISIERQKIKDRMEDMIKKELEIDKNLATMDKEIEEWKMRIKRREELAEKERMTKERMFLELREEYGYDINPEDPQFADRIAEKEKEFAKRNKEEKKKARAEKLAAKEERKAEFLSQQ